MSILIKGMKMPVFEHDSWDIREGTDGKWYMVDTNAETTDGEWHEIVPVPPHGPLIDTNKILEHKYVTIPPHRKEYADGKRKSEDEIIAFKHGWNSAIDAIVANAPVIIEAEEDEI